MTDSDSSRPADASTPDWAAVEAALERYFLAREEGKPIDVVAACGGDQALTEQVLKVLGESPDFVVEATTQPEFVPLDSFGDFDVVQSIGKGGMGTVYLAMQRSLGRQVALKVLHGVGKTMPAARTRMRREAELTALLEHPNIVPVYSVGEVGGAPFIAMKYVAGPSLAEIDQPLTSEAIAELGAALADGLDAAHLQGIVHRDVKPANILMDGAVPVLVDFGLARGQTDVTLTQEGKVAGTLRYMAPERLDARTEVLDPRVDIYGLGATLYELLAGRELFADQNPTALVRSVLAREPAPMRLRGRDHDLETVVLRALAKEPGRRFATAREMAEDLRRYLRSEPVASRRLGRAQRALRTAQRYPRTTALLAAVVLLVAVTVGIVMRNAGAANEDRRARLAQAMQHTRQGHHHRAQESLQLLARTYPNSLEVREALAAADAEVAIEELLVAVANRSSVYEASVVEHLSRRAQASAREQRRDGNERLSGHVALSRAIALHQSASAQRAAGRSAIDDALAAASDEVRRSRPGVAVGLLLAGSPLPWSLPDHRADPAADDVLLAAIALRLAGAPGTQVLEELSQAAATGSTRLLFLEAAVRWDLGQDAIAEAMLKGLAERWRAPVVWRWLAKVQVSLGKYALARASLQRAGARRPRSADRLHYQIALGLAVEAADQEAMDALVDELRALPSPHPEVVRLLAEYDGKTSVEGVDPAVEQVLALASAETLAPADRDSYIATAMEIAAWHLPREVATSDSSSLHASHRSYVARWRKHVADMLPGEAQRRAEHWLACSMCLGGDVRARAEGLVLLRKLSQNESVSPETVAFYASAAFGIDADADTDVSPFAARLYRGDALRAIDAVLARIERGYLTVPLAVHRGLHTSGALLAQSLGDALGAAQRRLRTPAGDDDADQAKLDLYADWVNATLERFALSR